MCHSRAVVTSRPMLDNAMDLIAVLGLAVGTFLWGWWLQRTDHKLTRAQLRMAHDEIRRLRQELRRGRV